MAKSSSAQQSSQLKKLLLLGGGLVVIVFVAFPSGSPAPIAKDPNAPKANNSSFAGKGATKKVDPYDTKEDHEAKFERIGATIKNGFVPTIKKGDGVLTKSDIPSSWADGEGTWTYTGNMVVDGTPNALLENSSSGDGVFLRPGQHWKNLRLIAVKDDSIEIEGPGGLRKTVYFNEKTSAGTSSTPLQALPPAAIQGNIPNNNGANPQFGQPGGRRNRGPQADQGNAEAMMGPIGATDNLTSSIDDTYQSNNVDTSKKSRRIGRNQ